MGQPARPGGRPGRLRPRAARRRTTPSPPTASTASPGAAASTRSTCSACSAASTTAAGTPNEKNFHLYTIIIGAQTLHATGYAMGVQRDGSVGTGDDDRDTAVIAYFGDGATSQGDVSEALVFAGVNNSPVVFFCQNNQWAISEPEREADPRPALAPRPRLRLPRRPGRRQRRARRLRRHQGRARRRPLRPGPDLHRGLHLPDGRAHHLRRPHQVPRLGRGRGVEAPRPDRAVQALARRPTGRADADFFDAVEEESDELGASVRERCLAHARPARHRHVRPRLRRAAPAHRRASGPSSSATSASFEEAH